MSALDRACPCGICGERTHGVEKCPALWAPMKIDVFFKPAGGRPTGGDDDDEGGGSVDGEGAKKLTGVEPMVAVSPVVPNKDNVQTQYHEHRRVLHLL
jgi:hypothetical protein